MNRCCSPAAPGSFSQCSGHGMRLSVLSTRHAATRGSLEQRRRQSFSFHVVVAEIAATTGKMLAVAPGECDSKRPILESCEPRDTEEIGDVAGSDFY